tara:strand:+ start:973 stop:1086 length:114 start_codon:yes stop_codon:yes gene_type:complete
MFEQMDQVKNKMSDDARIDAFCVVEKNSKQQASYKTH